MTTATRSIDVNVPIQVAYNQWTQMESYPRFMAAVKSVEQLDDTHTAWHMSLGGVTRTFTAEITEQIPDERICWTAMGEPTQAGEVSFEAIDDVTRVQLTVDWEPEGLAENLAAAFMVDDELVEADLQAFKRLIESQGFAEGAWRGTVEDTPGGTVVFPS